MEGPWYNNFEPLDTLCIECGKFLGVSRSDSKDFMPMCGECRKVLKLDGSLMDEAKPIRRKFSAFIGGRRLR